MPELVLRGGTLVTVGPLGTLVADIAVDGGRIVAIGADVGTGDEELDVRGCVVTPGFVQAHVHLCQTLFRGLADDRDVIDWLRERVWPLERAHDDASVGASAALGIAELLLGGTTTVLAMETIRHTDATFAAAARLGIRALVGKALMDRWEPGTEMEGEDTEDAWSDVVTHLSRWHGAADGRISVVLSPRSPRNATPELWRRCVSLAADADLVLHTHVDENRAQADRFGATAEGRDLVALESWGALVPRLVMAHAVWLDAEERALLRRRRPSVCHCPSANLKLASGIAPIPEYLADGVNVALGADGAACNNRLDAFTEMRLAALLHKPRCGPRSMPAAAVLEMATMGGARAVGRAEDIGSIEVGKAADLAVVRVDRSHVAPLAGSLPADQIVYACQASDVSFVMVAGSVVVGDGRLRTGDETAIVSEAETQRVALLARAGIGRR